VLAIGLLTAIVVSVAVLRVRSSRFDTAPAGPPANLILISIDTLRADHLGCYGYGRPTSPAVDRLCGDAVVFEQTFSHAPSTLMSHASIFSSSIPEHHGASFYDFRALPAEALTIAEVLRDAGYATVGVTGGGQMSTPYGLGQGFDQYVEEDSFGLVWQRGLELSQTDAASPFMLFLHTYDVHHPYLPTPEAMALFDGDYTGPLPDLIQVPLLHGINFSNQPATADDIQHIVNAYDGGIADMDRELGLFLSELKRLGLYDSSLIVFTSDHGEEFMEHGIVGWHSHTLFDELLRVPFVMKLPSGAYAGTRVPQMTRGIDMAPTMLAALGVPAPPEFEGRSLYPLPARDDDVDAMVTLRREYSAGQTQYTGVRTLEWKLTGDALYDLRTDPRETTDVSVRFARVADALREERLKSVRARPSRDGEPFDPSDELKNRLRSLGYTVR
jgi:arylsulfatase A-like enzyme